MRRWLYRGFVRTSTQSYGHDFTPLLGFPFLQRGMEKNHTLLFHFHFITEFQISLQCVFYYSCHSAVVWNYDIIQIKGSWIFCFSRTKLWGVETNMAVANAMTCKIGFIWRHNRTSMLITPQAYRQGPILQCFMFWRNVLVKTLII